MKKTVALILAFLMTCTLFAACGNSAAESPAASSSSGAAEPAASGSEPSPEGSKTLRLAWTVSYQEDHPYTVAAETFKKVVEEQTQGRLTVELFPAGQLGGDVEMFEALQMGTLDVCVNSTPTVANFTNVLSGCDMPYIFQNNYQTLWDVLMGETGQYLCQRLEEETGVKGLSFVFQPFRHFFTNKKISSIDDLKGLKMRSMQTPIHQEFFSTIGASPVTLPYNDIYSAMQQGTIDGFESDVIGATASKFYEVSKYVTVSGHFNNNVMLLMSPASFDALSADDQAIMLQAAQEAAKASYDISVSQNDKHMQNMVDNGMEIVEIDMEPIYQAVQPMIDRYSSDVPECKMVVDAAKEALAKNS